MEPCRRAPKVVRWIVSLLAITITVAFGRVASAFPTMMRHEYTSCAPCHADPSGSGILTLYGRAQSEVLVRTRYGAPPEDEDPSKLGGLAFGLVPLPSNAFLAQADVRALAAWIQPPSPAPLTSRLILMQADAAAAVSVDRVRASVSVGVLPEGGDAAAVTHGDGARLVSRTHWMGASVGANDEGLVRAGRIPLPFGLRIPEHTTWVRSLTRTDVNTGQQHGVAFAWNDGPWRAEAMLVIGNMQLAPPDLRERGYAAYAERSFGPSLAVGASSLVLHTDLELDAGAAVFRQAHGAFARWVPTRAVVVQAEVDLLVRSPARQPIDVGTVGLLQVDVEPIQGVHLVATSELANPRIGPRAFDLGAWGSLVWFFLPHVDARADVVLRSVATETGRSEVTSFLLQLHAFL